MSGGATGSLAFGEMAWHAVAAGTLLCSLCGHGASLSSALVHGPWRLAYAKALSNVIKVPATPSPMWAVTSRPGYVGACKIE